MKVKRFWAALRRLPKVTTSTAVVSKYGATVSFLWCAFSPSRAVCLVTRKKALRKLATKDNPTHAMHKESHTFLCDIGCGEANEKTGHRARYLEVDKSALRALLDNVESDTVQIGFTDFAFKGEYLPHRALLVMDSALTDGAVFIGSYEKFSEPMSRGVRKDFYEASPKHAWEQTKEGKAALRMGEAQKETVTPKPRTKAVAKQEVQKVERKLKKALGKQLELLEEED